MKVRDWSNSKILAALGDPERYPNVPAAVARLPVARRVALGVASPAEVRALEEARRRKHRPRKRTEAAKRYLRAMRDLRGGQPQ